MKIRQLTHSLIAKIVCYFLMLITITLTIGCILGGMFMAEYDFYTNTENQVKYNRFASVVYYDGYAVLRHSLLGRDDYVLNYCKDKNYKFEYFNSAGDKLGGNYNGKPTIYSYTDYYSTTDLLRGDEIEPKENEELYVKSYIDDEFPLGDDYELMNRVISISYSFRYWVYVIGIISASVAVIGFIFLMCSAGHKAGHEKIVEVGLVKVPFDLLSGVFFLGVFAELSLFFDYGINGYEDVIATVVLYILSVILGVGYCMNVAVRMKTGYWWKNTIIYHALVFAIQVCRGIWKGIVTLVQNIPILWKTIVILTVITGLELFCFAVFWYESDVLLVLFLLGQAVIIPAILYIALVLRKLQKGGEALARGNLSYQIDTRRMFLDFKQHGENLNSIAEGMTHAVEERMKSERFKTELITNVSHDIKTPLTSIINYTDLIAREQTENSNIIEYAKVLMRQSERLKKLIEDLVEASKASTGNMDVLLTPCEVDVLLTQTAGEYQQRLQNENLEFIIKQPENPVKIMADGKHLWRVFDNLMNNICKYSQSGTRVYLNVEEKNGKVVISFKNTSKYALDISADELMGRFVRGDSSRNTDGNGLGLSISQSLTELQGGKMELTVDGDLFKVILEFNTI